MKELTQIADIPDLGVVYQVESPFDEAISSLRSKEIDNPINVWDEAYLRIVLGKSRYVCNNGCYTSQGFIHAKNEPPLLSMCSPLLNRELAKQAVEANRNNQYFSTANREVYEKNRKIAEEDKSKSPEQRRVLILPSSSPFYISHTENKEIYDGVFHREILGEKIRKGEVQDYLDFLKYNSLRVIPVHKNIVNSQDGTLLTELWLYGIGDNDLLGLDGNVRSLYYDSRVRGVLMKTSEAGS